MTTDALQSITQPFAKLVQSNMDLMQKYALSPEVVKQAMNDMQKIFQQAQDSAAKLLQSDAYAALMQGMMKNFSEFCAESAQGAAAALSQGQAAVLHRAEAVTGEVIDATNANTRRARQAA